MQQTRIVQVDALTGEILEGATLAVHYPKRTNGFQHGGWIAMAQHPAIAIAQLNLGAEAYRVLWHAIGHLDFENLLVLNQTEAATRLGMKQQNFARALAKLIDAEIIEKGPKVSGRNTYRMNPSFGWKGSAKSHREALNARIKEAGLTVHKGGKLAAEHQ